MHSGEASAAPRAEGTDRSRGLARAGGWLFGRPETGVVAATLSVFVFFSLWADRFLSTDSLASTLAITAELAIVAVAITLLMIAGEFDLSVGSVLGVSSVTVPWLITEQDVPVAVAILAGLGAAVTIGFLQGALIVTTRIPSFIITLGGLLFWRAVVFVITKGFPVAVPEGGFLFDVFAYRFPSGFQVSAFWLIAVAGSLAFVLSRTKWGNWIYASGDNEGAARGLGVPVDRLRLSLFMVTAGAAGLVGIIQLGRFGSVDSNRGVGLELEAIAAAVIGGARLTGGYGTVLGTLLGCLMIGMIRNGLTLGGVASYWYNGIVGLLLVAAVIINFVAGRTGRWGR
jgi:simple sugar transport system permease protein